MRDIAKIKDNSPNIEKDIKFLDSVLETKDEILYTIYNYSVSDYAYLRANYSYRKFYFLRT